MSLERFKRKSLLYKNETTSREVPKVEAKEVKKEVKKKK